MPDQLNCFLLPIIFDVLNFLYDFQRRHFRGELHSCSERKRAPHSCR
jgi:hypothetical protein